ncbi:MAG: KpsF/GutQ family sugar-phosphate isomerase [Flavobacteriales bacterium]|nr:KpsF/GutQ family sugar-phosphate isomerase [Flavobacteriales bacterium]
MAKLNKSTSPKGTKPLSDAARRTLKLESEAVARLVDYVDEGFLGAARAILSGKGRLVVTGIGKSANIAQKLVATLNSTGQPALFMHAADAIHGDLGMVQKADLVMIISKSGDSPEIKFLVPLVKSMGNTVIGMVSNTSGFLARKSDFVIRTTVEREACPINLAPTTSTTAQLAMGDALAVALMEHRGFTDRDFARYHPGGALGKKLYVRMGDLIPTAGTSKSKPAVKETTPFKDVIVAISAGRVGAVAVLKGEKVVGIVTDGDVRRTLQQHSVLDRLKASDVMTRAPRMMDEDELAVTGFQLMEAHSISQLVVNKAGKFKGIVHLHDILKEGIF